MLHEGRFPGAAGADEGEESIPADVEREVVQRNGFGGKAGVVHVAEFLRGDHGGPCGRGGGGSR